MTKNHTLRSYRLSTIVLSMKPEDFIAAGSRLYGSYGWQTELAEKLGMNKATINRYAMGKLPIPARIKIALDGLEAKR